METFLIYFTFAKKQDITMLNSKEFTNRIQKIMEYHQISASSFADKVGVQRSSISHVLSGRNKPSLDFVLKITKVFTEVTLDWLLNGTDEFPKTKGAPTPLFNNKPQNNLSKNMKRIVVFYNDGTFEEFKK